MFFFLVRVVVDCRSLVLFLFGGGGGLEELVVVVFVVGVRALGRVVLLVAVGRAVCSSSSARKNVALLVIFFVLLLFVFLVVVVFLVAVALLVVLAAAVDVELAGQCVAHITHRALLLWHLLLLLLLLLVVGSSGCGGRFNRIGLRLVELHLVAALLLRLVLVGLAPQHDLLLLEVASLLLVHEHQVQVVLARELLLDVAHRRRQVVGAQEQPNRDGLALDWRAVHDLVLADRLSLALAVVAHDLALDDRQLHVLHLHN